MIKRIFVLIFAIAFQIVSGLWVENNFEIVYYVTRNAPEWLSNNSALIALLSGVILVLLMYTSIALLLGAFTNLYYGYGVRNCIVMQMQRFVGVFYLLPLVLVRLAWDTQWLHIRAGDFNPKSELLYNDFVLPLISDYESIVIPIVFAATLYAIISFIYNEFKSLHKIINTISFLLLLHFIYAVTYSFWTCFKYGIVYLFVILALFFVNTLVLISARKHQYEITPLFILKVEDYDNKVSDEQNID